MRVKKYLALTFAAILATTMLTACPWDQEEDETDDASSVPVTSTDTSQDDDDHDSGDDDGGQEEDNLTRGDITITESQNGKIDNVTLENTGTYTITFTATPTEKYIASSVSVTGSTKDGGSFSGSWSAAGSTATFARASAETTVTITPDADYKKFTVTGIPANTEECNISVTFADLGYVIDGGTYKVYSAEGLKAFADAVNGGKTGLNCTLTANIDLGEEDWTPIGNFSNLYTGTFDGGGHTISGLQISSIGSNNVGMFGCVGNGGTVQNVNLTNVSVSGGTGVGGMVGTNGGTIQGCMVSGSVSGNDLVGGVAGDNHGTVKGCCFAGGSVSGSNYVGGVVGYYYTGSITACYWQAGTGGPSQGVGFGDGGENCEKVEGGDWTDAIDAMNKYLTGYQYELKGGQIVLVASNSNTPEVSGLTQKVLDTVRALGL